MLGEERKSISGDWTSESSQQRKFVVFDRRRFVIANSRPIPVRALAKIFSEPVSSDSSNSNWIRRMIQV